jgi:hypothetical protein
LPYIVVAAANNHNIFNSLVVPKPNVTAGALWRRHCTVRALRNLSGFIDMQIFFSLSLYTDCIYAHQSRLQFKSNTTYVNSMSQKKTHPKYFEM